MAPRAPVAPGQPGGFVQPAAAVQAKPGQPGIAIAGFVTGLVGLLLSITIVCWFLGLPISIVGTVLGALGVRQSNERGVSKGLPMAGMICGIVGIVVSLVVTVLVIVL